MLKDYYTITKPGIIYGNILTTIAGFLFASYGAIQFKLLILTLLGLSCVIAGGCVINNYIDRDIDGIMERTKKRPSVLGKISKINMLFFSFLLILSGVLTLYLFTNPTASILAIVGLFIYVVVYTVWLKRTSVHSTLIGSMSGAIPILVGYVAVQGMIDFAGLLLFLIMVIWQMPHFFAIAIYRFEDYKKANLPVLPVNKGIQKTKIIVFLYITLFLFTSLLVTIFGYAGKAYFIVMACVGLVWAGIALQGLSLHNTEEKKWAKNMFLFSIVVMMTFCFTLVLDHFI